MGGFQPKESLHPDYAIPAVTIESAIAWQSRQRKVTLSGSS